MHLCMNARLKVALPLRGFFPRQSSRGVMAPGRTTELGAFALASIVKPLGCHAPLFITYIPLMSSHQPSSPFRCHNTTMPPLPILAPAKSLSFRHLLPQYLSPLAGRHPSLPAHLHLPPIRPLLSHHLTPHITPDLDRPALRFTRSAYLPPLIPFAPFQRCGRTKPAMFAPCLSPTEDPRLSSLTPCRVATRFVMKRLPHS